MKKYILFLTFIFLTVFVYSQEDSRYLDGAVPEVEGRVAFSKIITPRVAMSDGDLYALMTKWANTNYNGVEKEDLMNKVFLNDEAKKNIVCGGQIYLVFRSNFFVLDRAKMSYQLLLTVKSGKCEVLMRGLRYDYEEEKNIVAEELIIDKVALNKEKDKLNNHYGKFRKHTIDNVDQIFQSIESYLNGSKSESETVSVAVVSQDKEQNINQNKVEMANYKNISSEKIPAKLLNDWTLISSGGKETPNVITALWGGTGSFGTTAVAFSLLNQGNGSVQVLEKENTYVVSFYTEIYKEALEKFNSTKGSIDEKIKESGLTPIQTPSGATTFGEAWMIIECKKGTAQPAPKVSVADVNDNNKESYNQTYIGEILNVWVK